MKNSQAKNGKIYFLSEIVHSGQNTVVICSRIIVIYVHAFFYSKVHPVCHNIANGIKPGRNSKTTDKHAAECSKLYDGA